MNSSKTLAIIFGLLIVLGLSTARGQNSFVVVTLRNLVFDQYQRLAPRKKLQQPVRIVDIDEESLRQVGQFPWPRNEFAKLVSRLGELGAAAITFDVVFSEPDRLSPSTILKRQDLKSWLKKSDGTPQAGLPDNDKIFAKAVAQAPVVVGFGTVDGTVQKAPALKSGFAYTGNGTLTSLPSFKSITPLIRALEEAATGVGSVSLSPGDATGVIRKIPLMWSQDGTAYPSLSLEALRVAQRASTFIVKGVDETPGIVQGIKVGAFAIDTNEAGELWLHYRYDDPDLYVPAHKLLRGDGKDDAALREKIAGHIVLIGTSATGLLDIRTTALGQNVPGVSIHAQALEQILSQNFLWRPDWARGAEILLIMFIGIVIVFVATFFRPTTSLGIGAIFAVMLVAGSWIAFKQYGLLLDPSFALAGGLGVHIVMAAYRYFVTDREARMVRTAFSKYVSPAVLNEIESHHGSLKLGGDTRDLTIMFVDIRNFTPLSEALSPEELVAFLNKLLSELSACVVDENGTIDKYIGDSIMAFWNAPVDTPDHQACACRAALKMRERLANLNSSDAFGFRERGFDFAEIAIGVGINTGPACAGNLGSQDRFDYSVIGDAVNVAARVESACKEVGADILVSKPTAEGADQFAFIDAGPISLKGKSEDQQIFVLAGDADMKASAEFKALVDCHGKAAGSTNGNQQTMLDECRKQARKLSPALEKFYGAMAAK